MLQYFRQHTVYQVIQHISCRTVALMVLCQFSDGQQISETCPQISENWPRTIRATFPQLTTYVSDPTHKYIELVIILVEVPSLIFGKVYHRALSLST